MRSRSGAAALVSAGFLMLAATVAGAQGPGGRVSGPVADSHRMANEIAARMDDTTFGWQYAIGQHGKLVANDSRGTARSKKDVGDHSQPMTATTRYDVASVTKNITAVATMKLLRALKLAVDSPVGPWLPADWPRGEGYATLTFANLLSHTSGIAQSVLALPQSERPKGLGWSGMRGTVALKVKPGSKRTFANANFALLRIITASMWKAQQGIAGPPVSDATHSGYALAALRSLVFTPAGLKGVSCTPGDLKSAGLSYRAGADQSMLGTLVGTAPRECAGADGIRLTAIELARYLAHLRRGKIVDRRDLARMDGSRLGWDEASNLGDGPDDDDLPEQPLSRGVFWHEGHQTRTGGIHLQTCAMTFPDGTQASMIANSPLADAGPCDVLLESWDAAR